MNGKLTIFDSPLFISNVSPFVCLAWKNETVAETKPKDIDATKANAVATEPEIRYDKPVPGSTLRCLDDPDFNPEINSPAVARPDATYERYWNITKNDNV